MPLSPMMQQYLKIKQENSDCIILFRLGDFYEMFFDDAIEISKALELTLTGRDCGLEERAPMCGVPYHAVDTYVARMIELGYRVAICEQLQDPKTTKGLVDRGVTRIITPGTLREQSLLSETKNNYLLYVFARQGEIGLAYCDISTGELILEQIKNQQALVDSVFRIDPAEILSNEAAA
ncbi:MAG: DNA mismatch repair protein MutS, partial [Clostridia bacterium]|nr:DNA mismatch repair protein MutS [Clostridia bacterium]